MLIREIEKEGFIKFEGKNKNKEILLEVALTLNKELFNENKISYKMFKYTEDNILKELKSCNLSGAH